MLPTVGRTVLYTLNATDAQNINGARSCGFGNEPRTHNTKHCPVGNHAVAGDVCAAIVVRIFDPAKWTVNLKVLLDGTDDHWATSRTFGEGEGEWRWPLVSS